MTDDLPRTKAGRALLEREDYNSRSFALITPEAILAIEDEMAALLKPKDSRCRDHIWESAEDGVTIVCRLCYYIKFSP